MNDRARSRRGARRAVPVSLQSVCDRLPLGFALFDAAMQLAAWNARLAVLRGYPRKLVKVGTPLESFVRFEAERGECGEGAVDALVRDRLAALKRRRRVEREQALPDGRTLRIVCDRVPEGGLLLTCEDVTGASRTAHRLRESEERYDFAMRATNEGMYDWDVANDTVHYSDRVYQAVGMSPDDYTTAAGWFERIHPDDQKRYLDTIRAHFKGETERFECDYRYRARDGSWHWARQHGLALRDASGRAVRLIGSTGNITELKERELQLAEHVAEQSAVRELLEAISRSAFDLDAVLRTLIESAARLAHADKGFIFRLEGDAYRLAVDYGGVAQAFRDFVAQHPIRPGRDTLVGRTALVKEVVHIEDVLADPAYRWPQSQRIGGQRTMLGVPIVRDETVIGVIALWKERVEPFTPAQVQLVSTFSSQASLAIENARLFGETKEALEQQTATSRVLGAISSSPTDLGPVYQAILSSITCLCEANIAALFLYDGEVLSSAASHGTTPEFAEHLARSRVRPSRQTTTRLAALERRTVHVADLLSDPAFSPEPRDLYERENVRTVLSVPMLREGALVGVITTWRREVRPFSDKQVALVRTFADQAVIAIEKVRLFNELEARNRDLSESLEQQTATAEILKVISHSPTDVQPVFEEILRAAVRLCDSSLAAVFRFDGQLLHLAATHNWSPEALARVASRYPAPPDPHQTSGRVILSGKVERQDDTLADPDYDQTSAAAGGWRRMLGVPMLKDGAPIGVIVVTWREPGPSPDRQVELLQTFADQAVIAIENGRLFKELEARNRELMGALDREKATGEILRVISSSPTDIQPVLDAVAERAGKLCDSPYTNVLLADADRLKVMSVYSTEPGPKPDRGNFVPIDRAYINGRAVVDREVVHIPDVLPLIDTEFPDIRRNQRKFGFRAVLVVPLMREGRAVGTIFIWRREPGLFTDDQVALLKTFADQAVIAIENVRLFNELQARNRELTEALEQQTATGEILRVISSSPTDLAPVFDAVANSVARLCDAPDVAIVKVEGDLMRFAASVGPFGGTFGPDLTIPINRRSVAGRAIVERRTIQVRDLAAEPEDEYPIGKELQRRYGHHTIVVAPLLFGDVALGAIAMLRKEARPFNDKQLALLRTFADQAVIAIQNVRLFNETKEALDHQKASAEVLQVISSSVADTKPVFDKILASCERLFEGRNLGICLVGDDGAVHLSAYHGLNREKLMQHFPVPLSEASGNGTAILQRRVIHYPDIEAEAVPDYAQRGGRIGGNRSVLFAPMLWEGRGIGSIFVGRASPGEFSEKEIALLKTFADQAVIAIQNARLFNEIEEKSRQLEIANQHKSAFLANMSHELRTPLNAVIGFSEMLAARYFGSLTEKQAEYVNDIHASGRHLLSLINDILDLSKIEAGRMELELGEFDLRAALDNALTLVRERAQRSGVTLRFDADGELGGFLGDERKLKQAMLNLLSNAVKFTPRGGVVSVAARRVDGAAEIAVSDTGVGIAPADQEAIFEAFRQVGTDVNRKREGTGLGLALTRRFVELHGGAIRVESAPGRGSTFTVTLPIRHGE